MSIDERDGDIESEIDDDTGEVRVKAAGPAPRGVATEAAASNGNGAPPPRSPRARSHHATAAAGVGSAPPTEPPNAEQAPWTYKEADLMLGEMLGGEHPRSLVKYGKTPYDFQAEVRRSDGVGGQSVCIKTIPGQELQGSADVTPGEVLRNIVGDVHLVSAKSPVTYDIWFSWRSPQRQYGKGRLQMPAPEEIIALRNAMRTSQQPYQPPYQPAQPPQQPPVGYGAPPVSNQRPPYQPPPGEYHPDGNPYGRRPEHQQPSRDPEVSNLRAEVGELRGAIGEMLEYMRGDRRAPPPASAAQVSQGFGGTPQERPWPTPRRRERTEADELRDELDDLREEMDAMRRGGRGGASGFGAAPQVQAPAPAPRQAPTAPAPLRGPNGAVWMDGFGWCFPQETVAQMVSQPVAQQAHAPQPAPAPAPAPAVQPQPAPAPARPVAGVGAMPVSPLRGFIDGAREFLRDGKEIRKVAAELEEVFGGNGGDVGLGAAEDPQTPSTPEEPESVLPFASEVVGGDGPDAPKLFGQPIRYVVDKETGKFDLKGFAFANPGIMEKGVEIAGIVSEGFRNLTARAAASAGTAAQFPAAAGVAGAPAPAQVVDNIPPDAKPAQTNGAGSGSFPRV